MKITLALVIIFMSFSAYQCKQIEKKKPEPAKEKKGSFIYPIVKVKKNKFYVYYYEENSNEGTTNEEETNQVYLKVLDPSGKQINKDTKLSLSVKEVRQIGYEAYFDLDEIVNIYGLNNSSGFIEKVNKRYYLLEGEKKILRFASQCYKAFPYEYIDVYKSYFLNRDKVLILYGNENRKQITLDSRVGILYYNRKTKYCQHQILGYAKPRSNPIISNILYYNDFFHIVWYSNKRNGNVITLWNPKSNERKDMLIKRPFAYQEISIGRIGKNLLMVWHERKRGENKSTIHTRLIKLD